MWSLSDACPSYVSFIICCLAVMSQAASEVGAAAEVTRGEPAEGEGFWAVLWVSSAPSQVLSVSISSELKTWDLLNVKLLFLAKAPGGLCLACPHQSPRAASCPFWLWLLPKLQGSHGRDWQIWCSHLPGLMALRCCCSCSDFPGSAWLCSEVDPSGVLSCWKHHLDMSSLE